MTVTGAFRSPSMMGLQAMLCYGDGSQQQHTGGGYERYKALLWYGPDDVGIDAHVDTIE